LLVFDSVVADSAQAADATLFPFASSRVGSPHLNDCAALVILL